MKGGYLVLIGRNANYYCLWETNPAIYYFSLAISLLGIYSVELKALACSSVCTKMFL